MKILDIRYVRLARQSEQAQVLAFLSSFWRHCLPVSVLALVLSLVSCASHEALAEPFSVKSDAGNALLATPLGEFDQPWSMVFLPDGQLLISEKPGQLWLLSTSDSGDSALSTASADTIMKTLVSGVPDVQAQGQGGLGDIIIHPDFSVNQLVYLSYVERDGGKSGAVVISAVLDTSNSTSPTLREHKVIWEQSPKVSGEGHYGHRLAFSESGHLFVTSGERQKFEPAQAMDQNLGKVVRLNDDGTVPEDNPFFDQGGVTAQIWSLGHRNPLGVAFDEFDQLWVHEMGPSGGDELNRVQAGGNYGYPIVSNGNHYNGSPIPDHSTRPDLQSPVISWSPVISPSSLIIVAGERFPDWRGNALIGGLSSRSLVRVVLAEAVQEVERFDMQRRIREVEQDDAGFLYVLEDRSRGRLLRLTRD